LIDADLYGPSIPTMLGLQGQKPKVKDVYGKPKITPLDAYGMPVMSIGFIIEPEQAVVLRGPRLGGIIKQFFNDTLWPALDFLIVDLPPGTGDIQLTLVQTVPVTGSVIVTTPQDVAVAPKELPNNKYHIFGEGGGKKLAKMSKSVLLGQVPLVQGIRESGDKGKPALLQDDALLSAPFLNVAKNTLRQVGIRNETLGPTKIIQVKQ